MGQSAKELLVGTHSFFPLNDFESPETGLRIPSFLVGLVLPKSGYEKLQTSLNMDGYVIWIRKTLIFF